MFHHQIIKFLTSRLNLKLTNNFSKVAVAWSRSKLYNNQKEIDEKLSELNKIITDQHHEVSKIIYIPYDFDCNYHKGVKEQFSDCDYIIAYPITGGTENNLLNLRYVRKPVIVYGDEYLNSLAAGIEIREHFRDYFIPSMMATKLTLEKQQKLMEQNKALYNKWLGLKFALLGDVSPWLINEGEFKIPYDKITKKDFYDKVNSITEKQGQDYVGNFLDENKKLVQCVNRKSTDLSKAGQIYLALHQLTNKYDGFTIGCFDLIGDIGCTPCLGLAFINSFQNTSAACEGELNQMLSMTIFKQFFKTTSFMCNLAYFDENSILFVHCTAPFLKNAKFSLHSHFESGIGVGVEVRMPLQRASVLKIRGRNAVIADIVVQEQQNDKRRCRTQLKIELKNKQQTLNFVENTLGNHHIIAYVDAAELKSLLEKLGFNVKLY